MPRRDVKVPDDREPHPEDGRRKDMKRVLLGLVLLTACGGQGSATSAGSTASATPSPMSTPEARVGPVGERGTAAASCVEGYSTSALPHRAFAFDGTITAIGPGGTNKPDKGSLDTSAVTFTVNEWFKGGTTSTVTVDLMSPTPNIAGDDTPAYQEGTRLLVSGEPRWGGQALEDAFAWSCGFTSYYENRLADEWRQATRA